MGTGTSKAEIERNYLNAQTTAAVRLRATQMKGLEEIYAKRGQRVVWRNLSVSCAGLKDPEIPAGSNIKYLTVPGYGDGNGALCGPSMLGACGLTYGPTGVPVLATSSKCQNWVRSAADVAEPIIGAACEKDPTHGGCFEWIAGRPGSRGRHVQAVREYCTPEMLADPTSGCRSSCKAYPGQCNDAAMEYCGQPGSDEGFCSCISSKSTTHPPACVDQTCIGKGYQLTATPPTCNITNCNVYWDVMNDGGGEINISDVLSAQACGVGGSGDPALDDIDAGLATPVIIDSSGVPLEGTGAVGETEDESEESGAMSKLLILIIIIVVATIIGAVLIKSISSRSAPSFEGVRSW